MSSTLDSRPNVVETDSAPNLFAKRASPVQSSKIRNTARLVLEKKTLRVLERRGIFGRADDGQEHFTAIRPPKFGDVEVSRVRQLCHPICQFQSVAKVSQGPKHDGSGKIRICLHRDWRQSHLFFLRLDSKGLGALRRCLHRTSPLVRKLCLRQHGDRWKNAMSETGKKLLVETFLTGLGINTKNHWILHLRLFENPNLPT